MTVEALGKPPTALDSRWVEMAPEKGLEPLTRRLTAACSTD
jgi:hypothetical protein